MKRGPANQASAAGAAVETAIATVAAVAGATSAGKHRPTTSWIRRRVPDKSGSGAGTAFLQRSDLFATGF